MRATRELLAGIARDPAFGTTIVLGVGGILAEAVADVSVRLVPISTVDAEDMLDELSSQALLGPFRGEPAVDRASVVAVLLALSDAARRVPGVVAIDLNPLMVVDGRVVAVDALIELAEPAETSAAGAE